MSSIRFGHSSCGSHRPLVRPPAFPQFCLSGPFQCLLAPGVCVTHEQQADKDRHFAQRVESKLPICNCPGEEEDGFDVEDDENETIEVEAVMELHRSGANGLNSALIRCVFYPIRAARNR